MKYIMGDMAQWQIFIRKMDFYRTANPSPLPSIEVTWK
jgi:hypothetical protein